MQSMVGRGLSLVLALLLVGGCLSPARPAGSVGVEGTSSPTGQAEASAATEVPPAATRVPSVETEAPPAATEVPPAGTEVPPADTEAPPAGTGVAADLARRLTTSTSVADAVAATREALALGGIATWDGQRYLVEAVAPAASGFIIPEESLILAMEARQRPTAGHLTLAQLGDMLEDMGWP